MKSFSLCTHMISSSMPLPAHKDGSDGPSAQRSSGFEWSTSTAPLSTETHGILLTHESHVHYNSDKASSASSDFILVWGSLNDSVRVTSSAGLDDDDLGFVQQR